MGIGNSNLKVIQTKDSERDQVLGKIKKCKHKREKEFFKSLNKSERTLSIIGNTDLNVKQSRVTVQSSVSLSFCGGGQMDVHLLPMTVCDTLDGPHRSGEKTEALGGQTTYQAGK